MKEECCLNCCWYQKFNKFECGRFPDGTTIQFADRHCCGEFNLFKVVE